MNERWMNLTYLRPRLPYQLWTPSVRSKVLHNASSVSFFLFFVFYPIKKCKLCYEILFGQTISAALLVFSRDGRRQKWRGFQPKRVQDSLWFTLSQLEGLATASPLDKLGHRLWWNWNFGRLQGQPTRDRFGEHKRSNCFCWRGTRNPRRPRFCNDCTTFQKHY